MIIGVPREIKNNENRVALTPAGSSVLTRQGHEVLVERAAGEGSGFRDEEYEGAGARIVEAAQAWERADMVMKVKEPLPEEYKYFRKDLILFAYLHLAPVPELTRALTEREVWGVAFETVQLDNRSLPLLSPMSEVAGRMSVQIGAQYLEKTHGGKGILLGGVPGVRPAEVVIVGGGMVGTNAAKRALGAGASVTVLDVNAERLRYIDDAFSGQVKTLASNPFELERAVAQADLLVGAVLVPGARAPKLVTEEMVKRMAPGSVIVDVAIDQGGSIGTIDRITTHDDPTYLKHGVVHYAVANMPGAVPRTSTLALENATLPYALKIAGQGIRAAAASDKALARGINTACGAVTYKAVAEETGLPYVSVNELLNAPAAV
ncbi:alanine dehydrogenase [Cohnella xylanilytica]|uniref:alanine dehydrogenase n=1 Tax=Cohnella xylanilytica TaxID=557555 RepID=UPI001B231983|nr:alanine dehydrogenase [Cohnella xylanilytica]GIO15197.1 alanine dehydrogenase [Cohnella xylanilytica]